MPYVFHSLEIKELEIAHWDDPESRVPPFIAFNIELLEFVTIG